MAKAARVEDWPRNDNRQSYGIAQPVMSHSSSSNVIVGKPIPPPLAGRYTWDSDDDSGIGHSRGGHGGSTSSSTEAETNIHDLSSPQKLSVNAKWRWNLPSPRKYENVNESRAVVNSNGVSVGRSQCQNDQIMKLGGNWANSDEMSSKKELVGVGKERSTPVANNHPRHDDRFWTHPNITLKNSFTNAHINSELSPRLLMPSIQSEKQSLPPTPSSTNLGCNSQLRGQSSGDANERSFGQTKKWDIRRVWSYSGENTYSSNANNTNFQGMNERMMAKKAAGVCNNLKGNSPVTNGIVRRPVYGESLAGNHEKSSPHLVSGLRGIQNCNWSGEGLSRSHSASLASLVTVDNVMIHAHACLAAVIPASEMGDTLSVIDINDEQTFKSDSISSPSSPLPPQPSPPWPVPPMPRISSTNLYSNSHVQFARSHLPHEVLAGNIYGNCQPPYVTYDAAKNQRPSVQNHIRKPENEAAYTAVNKPTYITNVSRATYATVNKPIIKKEVGPIIDNKRNACLSPCGDIDEAEPPLPPRNYRSEMANKRLVTSKSSLSTKMNGLTRSAKQALRKAFSLEGLNCIADPHNETQEWDNAEDWVHILALNKSNTPSAVKARDAIRDKSKVQRQQMATLC